MSAEDHGHDPSIDEVVVQYNGDPQTDEEYAASQITLRALVSTKEAGVIIGKQGRNVADLREQTGVKAGVSKVVQGILAPVLPATRPFASVSKVIRTKNKTKKKKEEKANNPILPHPLPLPHPTSTPANLREF